MSTPSFRPAWWIPGPHAQTLWGKLVRRQRPVPTRIERWDTDDGDFLDIHRLAGPPGAPRVLILHGLEGTIRSHYAQGLLGEMRRRGWSADLLIWRSCGAEPNRAPRFYHSGETTDLTYVVDRLVAEHPNDPLAITGVSLGGNVLLKFLGERGANLPKQLVAAAAVSVPFDLGRGCTYIDQGFSRIYQKYFMDSLKEKTREKVSRYPHLLDASRIDSLRTLREFDNALTAPLHGFRDADDYYNQSSSIHFLGGIRIKTLLLNAVDDPFLPPDVLTDVVRIAARNPCLRAEFPEHGGHAGFIGGSNPLRPDYYLERRVGEFLANSFAEQ
jgi:predicted alpha/beta-fold hydrolase